MSSIVAIINDKHPLVINSCFRARHATFICILNYRSLSSPLIMLPYQYFHVLNENSFGCLLVSIVWWTIYGSFMDANSQTKIHMEFQMCKWLEIISITIKCNRNVRHKHSLETNRFLMSSSLQWIHCFIQPRANFKDSKKWAFQHCLSCSLRRFISRCFVNINIIRWKRWKGGKLSLRRNVKTTNWSKDL